MIPSDTREEGAVPSGTHPAAWEAGQAHLKTIRPQPLHGVGVPQPEGVTNEEGYFAQEAYKRATGASSVLGVGINAALGAAAAVRRAIAPPPAGGDVADVEFLINTFGRAWNDYEIACRTGPSSKAIETRQPMLAARDTEIATLTREVERLRKLVEVPAHLRALSERATPGEWRAEESTSIVRGCSTFNSDGTVSRIGIPVLEGCLQSSFLGVGEATTTQREANTRLVAASVNFVRHLAVTTDRTAEGEAERG